MTSRILMMVLLTILSDSLDAEPASTLSRLESICAEGNFLKDYAEDLQRLGLQTLGTAQETERYRFEIVPAFSKSVVIDLQVLEDGRADAKAYEVPWDSESEVMPTPTRKLLSRKEVREFRKLLVQGEFWQRYHFGWGGGLDTREWIFEGIRGEDYQVFSTADPAPEKIELAGKMLFRALLGGEIPR